MVDLGALRDSSQPADVSADGSVIVGTGYTGSTDTSRAFRWTAETGFLDLGTLGGNSFAGAVSSDGLLIGGSSDAGAFIWDAANRMRDLKLTLAGLGVNMTGWSLGSAADIGYDGRNYYLVGNGTFDGQAAIYLATIEASAIPEPSTCMLALAGLGLTAGRRFSRH
jgi:probable HAF family extracellular repeat protein